MGAKPRAKGQSGEREIANLLNSVVIEVRQELSLTPHDVKDLPFQRNQNQSAVGGSDLSNPFGFAIEVKRQEALSVNTWWNQCVEQAIRTNDTPVLIYRQNRRAWRCRLLGFMSVNGLPAWRPDPHMPIEVDIAHFLDIFKEWYRRHCIGALHEE